MYVYRYSAGDMYTDIVQEPCSIPGEIGCGQEDISHVLCGASSGEHNLQGQGCHGRSRATVEPWYILSYMRISANHNHQGCRKPSLYIDVTSHSVHSHTVGIMQNAIMSSVASYYKLLASATAECHWYTRELTI